MNDEDFFEEKKDNTKNFNYFNAMKNVKKKINAANHFRFFKHLTTITHAELGNIGDEYVGIQAHCVPMDNYCLVNDNQNMLTYGIGTCCGLVVRKGNTNFLMHISPINSADDILYLLEFLGLNTESEIYIFPGRNCIYDGKDIEFDYNELANKLSINNNVTLRKFNSMSGSIYLLDGKLILDDSEPILVTEFNNSKKI